MTILLGGRLPTGQATALAAATLLFSIASSTGSAMAGDCRSYAQQGIDWSGCKKSMLIITESELDGANLTKTDFSFTDLRGSSMKSANLEKGKMVRASFVAAKLEGANFNKVEAYRSNFARSTADRATFVNAEVQRADFREAQLAGSDFTKAELGRADFRGATITGSRFTMANLARARLNDAVFTGPLDFRNAFLLLTRIEGLDLSSATGLEQEQIDLACGDASTRLPPGLVPPAGWPCADDPDDSSDP
ncbi:pentapeptide repeat-containing protein [Rhizobium sp. S95]|uniref:Pentapeptide repeat-containing protein n=2 Tax=Alphaproteobacteria TaxID=28211 RepID=A0AAJ1BV51_9HYPH|nr:MULTISPECIES: pentapeptide repeat-containing protein [unclassified Ciceribacter]MCM2395288.1 pentapeptide repeat-containing protein [Ciceribacter sp. S95]MCM2400351.1 pentapeptide repeat-containing protein [Ciceribacter sp. S153]MCO5955710.1 pentapeptide repeat-containing protein [Ciceribacter sp. S101]